jgi:hypothetical protein
MEFDELPNRMSGCAIAVHWHLGPELHIASNASFSDTFVLFVCFVVYRSPRPACLPWAHSSCRGEQVGPPERAKHSVLNRKVTCARPVTLVVLVRLDQVPQSKSAERDPL